MYKKNFDFFLGGRGAFILLNVIDVTTVKTDTSNHSCCNFVSVIYVLCAVPDMELRRVEK